jgi:NAD(P)-dependent dehydrogenase (short-subunit alcohol dehydrogenase family)
MDKPVVLITGALTGIGRATAVAFAKKGAKAIVVAGRRDEAGNALADELRSLGSEAEFIHADVRKEDEVRALVNETVARFGRLDIAVNNAGTEGRVGPITDQTAESYAATFDTNVLGVILSMKHEVRVMQGQGSGSIVNISSTYGHEGAAGASVYVGSKHAVEGITKSVALEIAESGIRVNGVAPGPTDTHRHVDPLHRHAREQGGARHRRPNGSPRLLGGGRRRRRLHLVGRGRVHYRPHPQRRRRSLRQLIPSRHGR